MLMKLNIHVWSCVQEYLHVAAFISRVQLVNVLHKRTNLLVLQS